MRQTAFERYHVDLKDVKRSKAWFDEKIESMDRRRITPNAIMMREQLESLTGTLIPSNLYLFYYDPKFKDTLPYYDMVPLVFPIERDEKSFLGLNMHYLDYPARFALFRALLKISGTTSLTADKKLILSWNTLKGVSKLAPAQACIKRYLFDHVKSPFLHIDAPDWATVMTMPLARFAKQSKETVWKESAKVRSW
jgi:hypothetical protein